ncbi:MAG: hypothetical protein IPH03_03795 [Tetrasphaera sp.]|nr:hypothetical protein [Tetrasphaera sp.]
MRPPPGWTGMGTGTGLDPEQDIGLRAQVAAAGRPTWRSWTSTRGSCTAPVTTSRGQAPVGSFS